MLRRFGANTVIQIITARGQGGHAPGCKPEGMRFDSAECCHQVGVAQRAEWRSPKPLTGVRVLALMPYLNAAVAQTVERCAENASVACSIQAGSTNHQSRGYSAAG